MDIRKQQPVCGQRTTCGGQLCSHMVEVLGIGLRFSGLATNSFTLRLSH